MVPGAIGTAGAIARAKTRLTVSGGRSGRRERGLEAQRAERCEPQRNGDHSRLPRHTPVSTPRDARHDGAQRPNHAGQSEHELHDERERPAETANHSWFSNGSDRVTTQQSPAERIPPLFAVPSAILGGSGKRRSSRPTLSLRHLSVSRKTNNFRAVINSPLSYQRESRRQPNRFVDRAAPLLVASCARQTSAPRIPIVHSKKTARPPNRRPLTNKRSS